MAWPAELRAWPVLEAVLGVVIASFLGADGRVELVVLVLLAALIRDWLWRLSAATLFSSPPGRP